jgi:hypothetical protein
MTEPVRLFKDDTPPPVDVTYLLPFASRREPRTARLPVVVALPLIVVEAREALPPDWVSEDWSVVAPATVSVLETPRAPLKLKALPRVVPTIDRLPGRVTVWPNLPIVIPVAVEVPMEIVPAPSMMTLPSPEMVVPVNVSDAKAIEAAPRVAAMMREMTMLGSLCFRTAYMVSCRYG